MKRKDFFKDGLKELTGELLGTPFGKIIDNQLHGIANLLSPEWMEDSPLLDGDGGAVTPVDPESLPDRLKPQEPEECYARPPGAIEDPGFFEKKCTRCNDCIMACPHGILFNLGPYSGPLLDPNRYPCKLCEGYPCIKSCETGALLPIPDDAIPKFGQAVLIEARCLNTPENRAEKVAKNKRAPYCRECVKICPVEEAISLEQRSKMPIFEEYCSGCGLCVKACPSVPSAIRIEI